MKRVALLLPLLLPALFAACSQATELSARFVDGRLAFVALHGEDVDCVKNLAVLVAATREVMWEIGAPSGRCQAALPLAYGRATLDEP